MLQCSISKLIYVDHSILYVWQNCFWHFTTCSSPFLIQSIKISCVSNYSNVNNFNLIESGYDNFLFHSSNHEWLYTILRINVFCISTYVVIYCCYFNVRQLVTHPSYSFCICICECINKWTCNKCECGI